MDSWESFVAYVKAHKGLVTGIGVGLLVGILILSIGFFRTLFLVICIGIGAFLGTNRKFRKKLLEILDRILPDIFK